MIQGSGAHERRRCRSIAVPIQTSSHSADKWERYYREKFLYCAISASILCTAVSLANGFCCEAKVLISVWMLCFFDDLLNLSAICSTRCCSTIPSWCSRDAWNTACMISVRSTTYPMRHRTFSGLSKVHYAWQGYKVPTLTISGRLCTPTQLKI